MVPLNMHLGNEYTFREMVISLRAHSWNNILDKKLVVKEKVLKES